MSQKPPLPRKKSVVGLPIVPPETDEHGAATEIDNIAPAYRSNENHMVGIGGSAGSVQVPTGNA